MKLHVIKTLGGLKPCHQGDIDIYNKIELNEVFEIEYKKKRNLMFHKKFFALIKLCFDNQSLYTNFEQLRYDLILTAGHFTEVTNLITGEVSKVPKSISFSSIDELEFNEVYNSVKSVISAFIGVENADLEKEIEQYF